MGHVRCGFECSRRRVRPLVAVATAIALGGLSAVATAQQRGQETFASAEDAGRALVAAVRGNDEKALTAIFGPDSSRIVSTGDGVEDRENRATFVEKYDQMHRLVNEPDGTTTLYIGAENWPTPVPLVQADGRWYFDTEAGVKEILYRQVGRNEISAIRVCQELVAAQQDFFSRDHGAYAEKLESDDGQQDGLYWKAAAGAPESPIGPMLADAAADAPADARGGGLAPAPFHGYYYRVLTAQGPDAPGGAESYVVKGRMTRGFAFVAFPAAYRTSGVMTFIVDRDGVVYEKDLGEKTTADARAMKAFEPDSSWQKAEAD